MQPKLKHQSSDLSLDGLEGLLDSTKEAESADTNASTTTGGDLNSQDWTVEETAKALGLSRGAVIRRLEDGIFPGYKVKRSYGWAWRVKPIWLADSANQDDDAAENKQENFSPDADTNARQAQQKTVNNEKNSASESDKKNDSKEFVEVFDAYEYDPRALPSLQMSNFRELIELKTKLEMTEFQFQDAVSKLETANYKIGYLEARLESSQEQIKLLTDSRRHEPWWQRWRQWFSTNQSQ